jgi:DUF218 domain-containing protein
MSLSTRRVSRIVAAIVVLAAVSAAIAPVRRAFLRGAGAVLVVNEPLAPVDVAAMAEGAQAGELELADLYKEGVTPRVMVITSAPTAIDLELRRRGVQHVNLTVGTLMELGVPRQAILTLESGEGGTTDGSAALAAWVAQHPSRVLVVVGATHGRRYRRALRRVWPSQAPPAVIRHPRAALFRSDDWWTSRATRREGLIELEKLAWDHIRFPW